MRYLLICTLLLFNTNVIAVEIPEIPAVKVDQPPILDGELSDPCWEEAPVATDFIDRYTGELMKDKTIAKMVYTDMSIYVCFYAYDSEPDNIVARVEKDQADVSVDDTLAVEIDPFHIHGRTSWFAFNPLGTKQCYVAGGTASKAEWIGLWDVVVTRWRDGWSAEVLIPWKILQYPTVNEPITMGLTLNRRQQRTNAFADWAPIGRKGHGVHDILPENFGHWVGVLPPKKERHIQLLPYVRSTYEEDMEYGVGLTSKQSIGSGITAVGTINPDFSNVMQDVEGLDFSYGKKWYPDRRPFFQEGKDHFETYGVYDSRRIEDIDLGFKLYGKPTDRNSFNALGTWHRHGDDHFVIGGGRTISDTTGVGVNYFARLGEEVCKGAQLGGGTRFGVFATGGNLTLVEREGETGYRWLHHFTLNWQGYGFKVVPRFISGDYDNPLGYEPFIGIKSTIVGFSKSFRWKSRIKEMILYVSYNFGDYEDGSVFRKTHQIFYIFQTHSDYKITISRDSGQFGEFDDTVTSIELKGRCTDAYTNYGVTYEWGRREEVAIKFVKPYASLRVKSFTTALEAQFSRHHENRDLYILTLNYDFTPGLGLLGRVVKGDNTDMHLAFRKSGYAGTDIYMIVKRHRDEEQKLVKSFTCKLVRPFGI